MLKEDTKICSICGSEKDLSEYYTQNKKRKDETPYIYYQPYCKECAIEKAAINQDINREHRKKKDYRYRHSEKGKNTLSKGKKNSRDRGVQLEWQRSHPDKTREYRQNKEMNRTHKISEQEWEDCKKYFNHRCAYCGLAIENHYIKYKGEIKSGDFHKEHVIHDGDNDISNCVPSCKSCNVKKNIFTLDEWYNESNDIFNIERLNKIHKWLNGDCITYLDS